MYVFFLLVWAVLWGLSVYNSIIQDLDTFKSGVRLQLFFSESSQGPSRTDTPLGGAFEHRKSLKQRSSFKPVGPFHLESMFLPIEQYLIDKNTENTRKKSSLKHNNEIVIKLADKDSALVIMARHYTLMKNKNNSTLSLWTHTYRPHWRGDI